MSKYQLSHRGQGLDEGCGKQPFCIEYDLHLYAVHATCLSRSWLVGSHYRLCQSLLLPNNDDDEDNDDSDGLTGKLSLPIVLASKFRAPAPTTTQILSRNKPLISLDVPAGADLASGKRLAVYSSNPNWLRVTGGGLLGRLNTGRGICGTRRVHVKPGQSSRFKTALLSHWQATSWLLESNATVFDAR